MRREIFTALQAFIYKACRASKKVSYKIMGKYAFIQWGLQRHL